jgi:hypothetical protein
VAAGITGAAIAAHTALSAVKRVRRRVHDNEPKVGG